MSRTRSWRRFSPKRCGEAARWRGEVVDFDFARRQRARLSTTDGRSLSAELVVGADGRASSTRKAAGIDMSRARFAQSALTLLLRHSRPHDDASTEFHTREGPFTLVPLPPALRRAASLQSRLVDAQRQRCAAPALDDATLAAEIRAQSHAILGEMEIEGGRGAVPDDDSARGATDGAARWRWSAMPRTHFRRSARRGSTWAARRRGHRRDGQAGAGRGRDIGGEAALEGYAAARRPDIALRTFAIGAVNAALLTPFSPVDVARGLGLAALAAHLRRCAALAMREGLNPFLAS